jgi:acetyl esterase/lipase
MLMRAVRFATPNRTLPRLIFAAVLLVAVLAGNDAGAVARQATPEPGEPAAPARHVTVTRDVRYGIADGVYLLLDAYVPDGGPYPAVLVIHGGGWHGGDKASFGRESERLAEAGFVAFAVNYRLAPPGGAWHFPAPADDVRTAVKWVRANAEQYHVDSTKVGALGGSAGANLALLLATTGQAGDDRVDAAVSWSGPTDLRSLVPGQTATPTAMNDRRTARPLNVERNYIGCEIDACLDLWTAASPYAQVDASTAPIYLANSTEELVPLAQATAMDAKLKETGIPYQLRVIDGSKHSRGYEDMVWGESIQFLRTHLGA